MKPNFALDFRNDKITLLHQRGADWTQIGQLSVDDPDLDAALGYLRSTAIGLSPQGIAAKLILPDDAILYTTIHDLSPDPDLRAAQIVQALVGRTPYAVQDLVYDWTDDGTDAHLAVIARETLVEAEGFAAQHRFHAVAFAAWPQTSAFGAEADFGPTQMAKNLAAFSDTPVVGSDAQTPPDDLSADDFEMGAPEPIETSEVFDLDAPADGEKDALDQPEILPEPPVSMEPPPSDVEKSDDIFGQKGDTDQSAQAVELAVVDQGQDDTDLPHEPAPEEAFVVLGDDAPKTADFVLGDHADDPAEADMTVPAVADNEDAVQAEWPSEEPPPADFAAAMAEADVIAPQDAALPDPETPDEAPMALDVPLDDTLPIPPSTSAPSISKADALLAAFAARREVALGKADGKADGRANAAINAIKVEPVLTTAPSAAPLRFAPSRNAPTPPAPDAGSVQMPAAPRPLSSKTAAKASPSASAKINSKTTAPKRNSAYLGFILTALLLIALAAAAAMSSYLTAAWNDYSADPIQMTQQDPMSTIDDELAADLGEVSFTRPENPPELAALPVQIIQPAIQSEPAPQLILSTSNSVPPTQPDLLPQPSLVEPPPVITASSQLPTPSAEDVLAPEAVTVISGRPSIIPAPRPDGIAPLTVSAPVADLTPSLRPAARPETVAPSVAFADPALVGKKPAQRPATIAPPQVAQIISDPALAGKRPLLRPDNILAAGREARLSTANASLVAQANAILGAEPRSTLAVSISRLPQRRPEGLRPPVVAVAPEIAPPEPVAPEPSEQLAANNQDIPLEADNEPEVVASKSSGPRTVVSRNATFKNALNLSRVNLIGVYGGKTNRYALVRQSNGRFKKLYVGDRFDGGLVAAITESEMRYSKGGEMVALKMPKG